MKINFKWEDVYSPHTGDYTERAKVIGGWILRTIRMFDGNEAISCMFVADPKHEWEIITIDESILNLSTSKLELTRRAHNCLLAFDIKTIGELINKTENDLLRQPNFGRVTINEIIIALEERGLSLAISR